MTITLAFKNFSLAAFFSFLWLSIQVSLFLLLPPYSFDSSTFILVLLSIQNGTPPLLMFGSSLTLLFFLRSKSLHALAATHYSFSFVRICCYVFSIIFVALGWYMADVFYLNLSPH